MKRFWILVAASSAMSLVACGPGTTVDSYCSQATDALVTAVAKCDAAPKDATQDVFGTFLSCNAMKAAVTAGKAKFDATKADACVALIKGSSCADLPSKFADPAGPCMTAVVGQVANGKSCDAGLECSSASYCDNGPNGDTCPGTCTAYVAKGGSCTSSTAVCDNSSSCDGTVCQPYAQKGASCSSSNGTFCDSNLYCAGETQSAPGSCQPLVAAGGTCNPGDGACQFGLSCIGTTCKALTAAGGACTSDAECGLFTSCTGGKCTEYPKVGGTCGFINNAYVDCVGSYCNYPSASAQTGTCTAYIAVGGTCDPNNYGSCGASAYCGSSNTCVAFCGAG